MGLQLSVEKGVRKGQARESALTRADWTIESHVQKISAELDRERRRVALGEWTDGRITKGEHGGLRK